MDIEQLKLVLATVQGVSGDAVKVGAIYIGAQFLKEIAGYGMGGAVLFTVYKVASQIINTIHSSGKAVQAIKAIRVSLGITKRIGEPDYYIDEGVIGETAACVEGLVKKFNESEKEAK